MSAGGVGPRRRCGHDLLSGVEPEQHAQQRRLPDTVRSEHGEQLTASKLEGDVAPEESVADAERDALGRDDRGRCHVARRDSAASSARAWASCQLWNDRYGGSVS